MKVLKRVDEDLSSLNRKAIRRKAELMALEKTVQKQNKKMLKLMGRIDLALERIVIAHLFHDPYFSFSLPFLSPLSNFFTFFLFPHTHNQQQDNRTR